MGVAKREVRVLPREWGYSTAEPRIGKGGDPMGNGTLTSDSDLINLLRVAGPLGVSEMADATEVTATAVRQRLTRLLAKGIIEREAISTGRGRPTHQYWVTDKGLQRNGPDFADLVLAIWQEFHATEAPQPRQQIVQRVVKTLAEKYAGEIQGETPTERMHSLGRLLTRWRFPASVTESPAGPVLMVRSCPYHSLAKREPAMCELERALFSELTGHDIGLVECRVDGGGSCRFHTAR